MEFAFIVSFFFLSKQEFCKLKGRALRGKKFSNNAITKLKSEKGEDLASIPKVKVLGL